MVVTVPRFFSHPSSLLSPSPLFSLLVVFFVVFVCFYGEMAAHGVREARSAGAARPRQGCAERNRIIYGETEGICGDWDGNRVYVDAGGMRRRPWGHFSAALTSPEGRGRRRAGILKDAGLGEKFSQLFAGM